LRFIKLFKIKEDNHFQRKLLTMIFKMRTSQEEMVNAEMLMDNLIPITHTSQLDQMMRDLKIFRRE
jgi:hypothetical protein